MNMCSGAVSSGNARRREIFFKLSDTKLQEEEDQLLGRKRYFADYTLLLKTFVRLDVKLPTMMGTALLTAYAVDEPPPPPIDRSIHFT